MNWDYVYSRGSASRWVPGPIPYCVKVFRCIESYICTMYFPWYTKPDAYEAGINNEDPVFYKEYSAYSLEHAVLEAQRYIREFFIECAEAIVPKPV